MRGMVFGVDYVPRRRRFLARAAAKPPVLLGTTLLFCVALAIGAFSLHHANDALSEQRTLWAIAQVDRDLFGGVPPFGTNCFALRAGQSNARVFVVDPSYTDYWDVRCDTSATQSGKDTLLMITQSWNAADAPDNASLWSRLRSLFYRSPSHTWSFRVHPDGSVVTLPERGASTPQSYAH